MVATRSGARSDARPLGDNDQAPESAADRGSGILIQPDSIATPQVDNTTSTERFDTMQGRPPTPSPPTPPPPTDVTVQIR
jgi:hypothetical protein